MPTESVEVVVGYLVTLPNGFECRMGPDHTRAMIYAAQQHGRLEPMYVRRGSILPTHHAPPKS